MICAGTDRAERGTVVTVPKDLWLPWLEEGDLPGEPWAGGYWSFYTGGAFPAALRFTGKGWSPKSLLPPFLAPSRGDDPGHNSPGTELGLEPTCG